MMYEFLCTVCGFGLGVCAYDLWTQFVRTHDETPARERR